MPIVLTTPTKQKMAPTRASAAPDFEKLVGRQGWANLHPAIRRRFQNHNLVVQYPGQLHVSANWVGKLFAVLLLPLGRPLPLTKNRNFDARVDVFPENNGGVVWRRDFLRPAKTPLRVESVKQLGPDGNLLECVRRGPLGGIGMGLKVFERNHGLCFQSHNYFIRWGRLRLPVPLTLTPGQTLVEHIDKGGGDFRFRLTMTHPWFGKTVAQDGIFKDPHGGRG
jgi:hypothetical protein